MSVAAQQRTGQHIAPLDEPQLSRLAQAVADLNNEQLLWASGYLAGLSNPAQVAAQTSQPGLTILYVSQTGNARGVAERLASEAKSRGVLARLVSADDYRPRDLLKENLLYVVISTQGEGEPPESAFELFRYLNVGKAPDLSKLRYAVFGLGDSSYEFFCQAAKDLDERFAALGATSVAARVDADVDFDKAALSWQNDVLQIAEQEAPAGDGTVVALQAVRSLPCHDRNHPYVAEVIESRRITTSDALSSVHHVALDIDSTALSYRPGDALGVYFNNAPELVEQIIAVAGVSADASVTIDDESLRLDDALFRHLELTQLRPSVVKTWAAIAGGEALQSLCADAQRLRDFAANHQFIDLLTEHTAKVDAQQLVDALQRLQPRLYSIASSQALYPDEVHLTVAKSSYEIGGQARLGGASGYLTERLSAGDALPVYVAENKGFRLPHDPRTPVIMVGAGTGIAPFRAFLQQREADEVSGKQWLVFGNRHFHRDFLYQSDWLAHRKAGRLDRISLAFSRDSDERPYVQQRLREEGAELYRWLNDGAHLYVCGGLAMEKAVHASLAEIAKVQGGLKDDAAAAFVDELRGQGRYLKDVY